MKLHHYFAVGLKLFSIVLFIYGVSYLSPLIEIYKFGSVNGVQADVTYYLVNFGLIIFVSGLLWLFPVTAAKCVLGTQQNQNVEPIPKQDVMAIVIIGIGLYVFVWGTVDIVYWCSYMYLSSNIPPSPEYPDIDSKSNIVATIVQLVLGLSLILKSKSLSASILRIAR